MATFSIEQKIPTLSFQRDARFAAVIEMRKLGEAMKKDFEAVASGWERKPKFVVNLSIHERDRIMVSVSTDDKLFLRLNKGVKKHAIYPRSRYSTTTFKSRSRILRKGEVVFRRSALKIPGGYIPKVAAYSKFKTLSPVAQMKIKRGYKADRFAFATHALNWPGIKARKWDKKILALWKPAIKSYLEPMTKAMLKGIKFTWRNAPIKS